MATVFSNIIVTTSDMDAAKAFYTGALHMAITEQGTIASSEIRDLWSLGETGPAKYMTLKRRLSDLHGDLLVLEVQGAVGQSIRLGTKPYDLGVLDFGITVRDIADKVSAIASLGYRVASPPTRYDFGYYDGKPPFYIVDSLIVGPDGVNVALLERFGASYEYGSIDSTTGFSEIIHAALVVDEVDPAVSFFHDVIGLSLKGLFRNVLEPAFSRILQIGSDEAMDWAFLVDKDERGSFVELLAPLGRRGKQIGTQGSMLNYGTAALSFVTDELAQVVQRARRAGVRVLCDPVTIATSETERWTFMTLRGPSEVVCEVRQRAD